MGALREGRRWRCAAAHLADPAEIAAVLHSVGEQAPLNHCFLPQSGGLDLSGAVLSTGEPGCIVLDFEQQQDFRLLRPRELALVQPAHDPLREWAYFRLDCAELAPSRVYNDGFDIAHEELVELEPGHYVERSVWDAGALGEDEHGQRIPLPDSARVITRQFHGTFTIFSKGSTYTALDTYEAHHALLSSAAFAEAIQHVVDALHARETYGRDPLDMHTDSPQSRPTTPG